MPPTFSIRVGFWSPSCSGVCAIRHRLCRLEGRGQREEGGFFQGDPVGWIGALKGKSMELVTKEQMDVLRANGREMMGEDISTRVWPVVKLFTPDAHATWLLAWVDPTDADIMWGLCDLGFPEIGPVRLSEIAAVRGALGLPVERDLYFEARKSLFDYATEARERGHIAT